jgi:Holliday junction resolvasome RuvABC ATP-dependent DNA helicase subunit
MEMAGNREAVIFSPQALQLVWENSRGIPRLINIICDFILLFAFTEGQTFITAELAEEVARELDFVHNYWGPPLSAVEASGLAAKSAVNPLDNTIRDLRTRVETIENRYEVNAYLLESARKRIDYFDHILREFMEHTDGKRDDLANN